MPGRKPTTKRLNASTARQHFSELVNEVHNGNSRILIERSGIPVAAIISPDDLARLQQRDQEREKLFDAIEEASQGFKDLTTEELERQITAAVASARRDIRRDQRIAAKRVRTARTA